MVRVLGSIVLSILAGSVVAAPEVRKDRAVIIEDVIQGRGLDKVQDRMLDLASDGSGDSIDLIINSPGGSVVTGFRFINIMQDLQGSGTQIRCFVSDLAASMAFQILLHCDERYMQERAFLLWHRVRIGFGGPATAPQLSAVAKDMQKLDNLIMRELVSTMNISTKEIKYHFENETLHTAVDLHTMDPRVFQVASYIPGLQAALRDKKVVRSTQPVFFFFGRLGIEPGTIFYMPSRAVLNKIGYLLEE